MNGVDILLIVFSTLLFIVLTTPGVVSRLPISGKPLMDAIVRGTIFAVVSYFTKTIILNTYYGEGFADAAKPAKKM